MDTLFIINVIGWIGSASVILAYVLLSMNRWQANSFVYQFVNLIGGIFLIVNTIYLNAYPSAFVNVMWVGIAFFALVSIVRKRPASN
jgi:hypothetical protein